MQSGNGFTDSIFKFEILLIAPGRGMEVNLSAMEIDILDVLSKRGKSGMPKDELLFEMARLVRGIAYDDMLKHIKSLEASDLVRTEAEGPDDFTAFITEKGTEILKTQ